MTSNYAGCGCTSMTSYAGPSFVPARARSFGAEDDKGMSDTQRTGGLIAAGVALVVMVLVFSSLAPPASARPIPTRNVPRQGASRR